MRRRPAGPSPREAFILSSDVDSVHRPRRGWETRPPALALLLFLTAKRAPPRSSANL